MKRQAAYEKITHRPKRGHGRKVIVSALRHSRRAIACIVLVVVLFLGGRWVWRQVQFTRLRVPLIEAVQAGDIARVRDLLDQGADSDIDVDYPREPFGWNSVLRVLRGDRSSISLQSRTVLMDAVRDNRVDIVRLLLEHGANVDLRDRPGQQWTALHYAASVGSIGCMEVLVVQGADVNAKDVNGAPPLYNAIFGDMHGEYPEGRKPGENGRRLLIEHGADVNRIRNDGVTPLMFAIDERSPSLLRLLTARSAFPYHQTDEKQHDRVKG